MPTPLEYMQIRASAFAALSNIQEYIDLAELEIGDEFCDDNMKNKAVFLLSAHWLALEERNNGGSGIAAPGTISSEKEGQLSRSYGAISSAEQNIDAYLSQTLWGIELYNLQKSCIMLPRHRFI